MSEAPEKLWLSAPDIDNEHDVWFDPDEGGTEYVRSDLYDRLQRENSELQAELADAREILADLLPPKLDWKEKFRKGDAEGIQVHHPYDVIRRARSFLAALRRPA